MLRLSAITVFLLAGARTVVADQPLTPENEAFFEAKVRPVLVAKCLSCHGPDQQKGNVRLDSADALRAGLDGEPLFVPGKPEDSRLMEVLSHEDAVKMPPKEKLPAEELAALTEWVRRGAPFPATRTTGLSPTSPEAIELAKATHWAYQPIRAAQLPEVTSEGWSGSRIDAFIAAKLEAAGLSPSPEADRATLVRRVTFDLTGLPPTYDEVQAFVQDRRPEAWEQLVDRLLASPRYGERWGRHWLDVARYADTKGYVFTEERKYPFSYTYRDYVIEAFNADKPFDQFIREQLAADQLPLEDKSALAAMGFLTLGRRFGNNMNDIIDDRIDVVSRGLLGLAVGCARCHDHKYDPIPTADYYALYGVFAASLEPAELPLIGEPVQSKEFAEYEAEVQKRQKEVDDFTDRKLAELRDTLRGKTGEYLLATTQADQFRERFRFGGGNNRSDLKRPVVERWVTYLGETTQKPHPVFEIWNRLAKLPRDKFAAEAPVVLAELNRPEAPRVNARVKAAFASPPEDLKSAADAYGRLFTAVQDEWVKLRKEQPDLASLPDAEAEELRQVLYAENSPVNVPRDTRRIFERDVQNEIRELQKKVDTFKATAKDAPPRAMVLNDVANPPAGARVFVRGNPGRPGEEIPRRFLRVLSPPEQKFATGSGRRELAEAIASPDNPLTARVIVNRVWMHHFGQGLVRTPSDFGVRGEKPSHPELLDDLARTFLDAGWSLKKLHRQILLSRAYRQQSVSRADAAMKDPENRLLWRMHPRRLEFEAVRDSLLAVSGALDLTSGGRSVDLFSQPFTRRRTVYGFIDRQDLPGLFRSFDFASPDVSTPQRPQTTVPQQALYTMNSPFVVEQARRLAATANSVSTPGEKITVLYRQTYGRDPQPGEVEAGEAFLATVNAQGSSLSPLDQYAQALLLSNEFVFVD